MAGGAPVSTGKGGKKPLDAEYNLVPFIDLLSVCISFLLITAVWTQTAKLSVKQSPTLPGQQQQQPDKPSLKLTVTISEKGYTISDAGGAMIRIDKAVDAYDSNKLIENLKTIKKNFPDEKNVTVLSEDGIPYKELITVMDVCLANDLPNISVSGML